MKRNLAECAIASLAMGLVFFSCNTVAKESTTYLHFGSYSRNAGRVPPTRAFLDEHIDFSTETADGERVSVLVAEKDYQRALKLFEEKDELRTEISFANHLRSRALEQSNMYQYFGWCDRDDSDEVANAFSANGIDFGMETGSWGSSVLVSSTDFQKAFDMFKSQDDLQKLILFNHYLIVFPARPWSSR